MIKSIEMTEGKKYKCVETPPRFSHYKGIVVEALSYVIGDIRYCEYISGGNVVLSTDMPYGFVETFKFEEIE